MFKNETSGTTTVTQSMRLVRQRAQALRPRREALPAPAGRRAQDRHRRCRPQRAARRGRCRAVLHQQLVPEARRHRRRQHACLLGLLTRVRRAATGSPPAERAVVGVGLGLGVGVVRDAPRWLHLGHDRQGAAHQALPLVPKLGRIRSRSLSESVPARRA